MFTKEFKITLEEGLVLQNLDKRNTYMLDKINFFSEYNNYIDKGKKIAFFQEILDMYEYDCQSATFDSTSLSSLEFFEIEEHKNNMLAYYNIIIIMGGIALNIFDKPLNRLRYAYEGINGPINTSQMLVRGYEELIRCKVNGTIPYGANLIFATLLESNLKSLIKVEFTKKSLQRIEEKINSGDIVLTDYETRYLDFLLYEYDLSNIRSSIQFEGVKATTQELYKLLIKYNIIEPQDNEAERLIQNTCTLNQLLGSTICAEIVEPTYLALIKMLFNTKKLNLRNNLAHCNYGYMNYHTLNVAALLYLLVSMTGNRQCLKDNY